MLLSCVWFRSRRTYSVARLALLPHQIARCVVSLRSTGHCVLWSSPSYRWVTHLSSVRAPLCNSEHLALSLFHLLHKHVSILCFAFKKENRCFFICSQFWLTAKSIKKRTRDENHQPSTGHLTLLIKLMRHILSILITDCSPLVHNAPSLSPMHCAVNNRFSP